MFSLMRISEGDHGLVLSYPLWAGIAFLVGAVVLVTAAIIGRSRLRRAWPISVATLVALWAGLYFVTFKATITDEAGSVYAFMRYDHTVRWKDAADIYLEQRSGAHDWYIVVLDRQRRSFDFNVAELSIDDRDRVMAYMVDRMPGSAFQRAPALLKRQAPLGPRPASFLSDQQI
jgi:hypothetical protein